MAINPGDQKKLGELLMRSSKMKERLDIAAVNMTNATAEMIKASELLKEADMLIGEILSGSLRLVVNRISVVDGSIGEVVERKNK